MPTIITSLSYAATQITDVLVSPLGSKRAYHDHGTRTWTQNLTKFVGQDKLVNTDPKREYNLQVQLPLDYRRSHQADLRTWLKFNLTRLPDAFQFTPYDYPSLDYRRPYSNDLRNVQYSLNDVVNTLLEVPVGVDQDLTFPVPDYRRPYSNDLRFWTQNITKFVGQDTLNPGKQYTDLPPIGFKLPYQLDLRTWTQNNTKFVGQDTLTTTKNFYSWPLTLDYRQPYQVDLRFWAQNALEVVLDPTIKPFAPLDWPITYKASIIDRFWAQNLSENTLAPATALPFALSAWPNPTGLPYQTDLHWWTQNTLENTLTSTTNPFAPIAWSLPQGLPYQNDLRTWVQARFQGLTDAFQFTPYDWQITYKPFGEPVDRFWTQNLVNNILFTQQPLVTYNFFTSPPQDYRPAYQTDLRTWTQTHFPSLTDAFQFTPYDWQPQDYRRPYQNDLRTWTQDIVIEPLVPASPAQQYDWPVPSGEKRPYQFDLRTWTQNSTKFIGTDALTASRNWYWWPLPPDYRQLYQTDLRTWTQNNTDLIGKDALFTFPFYQYNLPVPPDYRRDYQLDLRTWTQPVLTMPDAFLFTPYNYPSMDYRRDYQLDLRTWTQDLVPNALNPALAAHPTLPIAWPLTLDYRQPFQTDLRTWTLNNTTFLSTPLYRRAPYYAPKWPPVWVDRFWSQNLINNELGIGGLEALSQQYDWPNPRGLIYPTNLRTWTQNNTKHIGTDRLTAVRNYYEWKVPTGIAREFQGDLRTWLQGYRISYLTVDTRMPNKNLYWYPLPPDHRQPYATSLRWWTQNTTNLFGKDRINTTFAQYDWPLPRRRETYFLNIPRGTSIIELPHCLPFFTTVGRMRSF